MNTLKDFVEKFGFKDSTSGYIIFKSSAQFYVHPELLDQKKYDSTVKETIRRKILQMRYNLLDAIDIFLEELNKIEAEQVKGES
jgi:hypothetical protein